MQGENKKVKSKSSANFRFKKFEISQEGCAMKVGTDGVLLGAWADCSNAQTILDIGTGTGVIAIMLAQRSPNASVDAVEIDEAAFQTAEKNMENSPFSTQLNCIQDSIQDYSKITRKEYDLIVCNPPFFTGGTLSSQNKRNNVRHTIKLPTGDLLNSARKLLTPDGKFCVILPLIEGLRFKEQAKNYNLHCTKIVEVKPKVEKSVERLLLQFEKKPIKETTQQLIIQHEKRNDYTSDYIELTKDFYLKM